MKINEIINEGKTGPGLWANIAKKRASGAKMREKGAPGAPTEKALKAAQAGSKNESVSEDKDPCWDSYKQIGMKTKGGRKVPNCVPKEGVAEGAPNFDREWDEAIRYPEFVKLGKEAWIELVSKGKSVTVTRKNVNKINNTDAADPESFKLLDPEKQKRALAQLDTGDVEMPIVARYSDGYLELIGGNTRLTAQMAKDGQAEVWLFNVPEELTQGVAEGFSDIVKGVKRKVAGKTDPKEVEHTYGRIARSAIKHKTPDQAEKDIERYKKVAKVVNKEGVAEGERKLGPAPGQATPTAAERKKSRDYQFTTAAKKARDAQDKKGVAGKGSQLEETYHDDDEFFEAYGVMEYNDEMINEAKYQGRTVALNKPMQGDVKKFKVYVKNPNGNVVKVNFGQKGAKIKKNNPGRRKNFRARHNCDNPGPKTGARYWSCRKW